MDHPFSETEIPGLSKSRYVAGLQCPLLLYHKVNSPALFSPEPFAQYQFDQGKAAGRLATKLYEPGTVIPEFPLGDSLLKTGKALDEGKENIFEAAFSFQGIHVKVDILVNHGDGHVDIIEVKSSTKVKDQHFDDLAIQRFVLEGNDLSVDSAFLLHMNPDYRHPDGPLFLLSDESSAVDARMKDIPENLRAIRKVLRAKEPPKTDIGPHCGKPDDCPLKKQCWKHIPELSIFNIPNLRSEKWEFYKQGIVEIGQLPDWFKGKPYQKPFLDSCKTGKPIIDKPGLKSKLAELKEPLYFMDFETLMLAVPAHAGTKPWQQLTVQWSVHALKNGKLEHREFIHDSAGDPRIPFIESLLEVLGDSGSIIVYSAPFETGRLEEIAEAFPQYRERIDKVIARVWDQLLVFKNHYCDSRFKGSNSLKKVLPVIVPELSYKGLDVQEGGTAMAEYARMISLPAGKEKEKIKNSLLEYCKLDTLAMVEILGKLKGV
jgi:CRISPR/Cas system-associated exonuclease Cas4 (RecB family)